MRRWKLACITVTTLLFLLACGESAKVGTTVTSTAVIKATVISTAVIKTTVTSTDTAVATKLSLAQKTQVITLITSNTNHFTQIWTDGKIALGTQPYPSGDAGLAAFADPTSAASTFRDWRKDEDPGLAIGNLIDTFNKAEAFYTASIPDDALTTWRDDVSQLSTDMELWVKDGVSWQISATSTATLALDAQTVTNDFATVQKDIQVIQ